MVDTTYPNRTIVFITFNQGSTAYEASGVLISPDEVLTAAHVAYSSTAGVSTNIEVTPAYSAGAAPFGTIAGTVTHYNAINDANDLISISDSQYDYAVIHLATPTTAGYLGLDSGFTGGTATVAGYPGYSGLLTSADETFTTIPGYTLLSGTSIGSGSSGGPVYINTSGGPEIVGTVSAGSATTTSGRFTLVTSTELNTLTAWVAQDDGYSPVVNFVDNTSGAQGTLALTTVAPGGPSYLQWQYIWSSPDSVAMVAVAPNTFLHGGTGSDALQATSGQNVLDGGLGSNFLVGGTGTDTFFTDARAPGAVWNTIENFRTNDAATLWGYVQGVSTYTWDATPAGAVGATGATLRANIVGGTGRTGNSIDASITFAGLSVAQGKALQITTGTTAAGSYLYLSNPGV